MDANNSFSGDGRLTMSTCTPLSAHPGGSYGNAVAIQPDGKILIAGTCVGVTFEQIMLVRLLTDGSPDPSFDSDGIAFFSNPVQAKGSIGNAMALLPDGKILVAGTFGYRGLNGRLLYEDEGVVVKIKRGRFTGYNFRRRWHQVRRYGNELVRDHSGDVRSGES